uniref:Uncharacterized protein n=1 Tax=Oryza meridionalis TaxID=40149 RepID=A0A0E0EX58_9ORYZ
MSATEILQNGIYAIVATFFVTAVSFFLHFSPFVLLATAHQRDGAGGEVDAAAKHDSLRVISSLLTRGSSVEAYHHGRTILPYHGAGVRARASGGGGGAQVHGLDSSNADATARASTTAVGGGGWGVVVLAIGYHRWRCHWGAGDKDLGLVWSTPAACSPTPLPRPLILLLRSATLATTATRPLGSTALAKVAFLAMALWTVVPCSPWRTRFAVAPAVFSGRRSHIGTTAALETWWWSSPSPSKKVRRGKKTKEGREKTKRKEMDGKHDGGVMVLIL